MTTDNATVPPTSGLPGAASTATRPSPTAGLPKTTSVPTRRGWPPASRFSPRRKRRSWEDRREWRDRALRAEAEGEQLGFELNQYRWGLLKGWKGDHSPADIRNRFDSLEGELLAAHAQAQPAQAAFRFGYDAGTSDAERAAGGDEALGVTHWWSLQADGA